MANKINIGNTNIGSVKLGTADVSLYLGSNKVYPIQTDPPLFSIKYLNGQTYNSEYVCDDNPYYDYVESYFIPNKPNVTDVELSSCIRQIDDSTFDGCTYLSGVTMPNVEYIRSYAFSNCTSLSSVTIPSSIRTIEDEAFKESGLRNVTIQNSSTLTIGKRAFENCSNLTGFTFGSGTTYISGSDYGDGIFYYCQSLSSITIPNNVMSMGGGMFEECTSLESVNIGSGITEIGMHSFYNCNSLRHLNSNINGTCNIPSGITDIGIAAFCGCSRFSYMYIPSGVTRIGEGAFDYCYGLTDVYIYATTPPTIISSGAATDLDIFTSDDLSTIYVPASSVSSYQSDSFWSKYASIIRALPNS